MAHRLLTVAACLVTATPLPADEPFDMANPPPSWERIINMLTLDGPMETGFTEYRRNPFHRNAVRFQGTIRWEPGLGLSIQYEKPMEMVLNISGAEIYRTGEGATKRLLAGGDHLEVLLLFSKLFAWDQQWLATHFQSVGQIGPEGNWHLGFSPVGTHVGRVISRIDLSGGPTRLNSILVGLPGRRSLEILLENPRFPEAFCLRIIHEAFPFKDE